MTEFEIARMERDWKRSQDTQSANDQIWRGGQWAWTNVPLLFAALRLATRTEPPARGEDVANDARDAARYRQLRGQAVTVAGTREALAFVTLDRWVDAALTPPSAKGDGL